MKALWLTLLVFWLLLFVVLVSSANPSERSRAARLLADQRMVVGGGTLCDGYIHLYKDEIIAPGVIAQALAGGPNYYTGRLSHCRVILENGINWPWRKFCTVVVHEFLHFTAFWNNRHSSQSGSIMYHRAWRGNRYWRCGANHKKIIPIFSNQLLEGGVQNE